MGALKSWPASMGLIGGRGSLSSQSFSHKGGQRLSGHSGRRLLATGRAPY